MLLHERKMRIELGGGEKRIADQHSKGKKTARERLALLLDAGSFMELDVFVQTDVADAQKIGYENPGEGVVTGCGTINGRAVYIYAQEIGRAHV